MASPAVRLRPMAVALAGAITPADVARAVVTHGVTALGAVAGCVAALDTAGLRFRVLASSGYSEALTEDWRRFRSDAHLPVVEAVRTRSPVLIESMIEGLARFPELSGLYSEAGNAAIAAVPLVAGGHAIGGAWVSYPGSGRFTEADRELLRIFAELAAGALHRAQSRAGLALGWSSTQ